MLIRPALEGDIAAALAVMGQAFELHLRAPTVHTLVARSGSGELFVACDDDGSVVGTAASVRFGSSGWLGGVTVAPEARGSGLGRSLTETALNALGDVETTSLLATPLGRPIYERLGFADECVYRVFTSGAGRPEKTVELRDVRAEDRDAVLALDREATGEDRSLAVLAAMDGAVSVPDRSAVALRPPWRALPIVGEPAAATTLLTSLLEPGLRVAVPESNAAAVRLLSLLGREGEPVVRMRRGPALDWRPERVWGVFSLFFG